MGNKGAAMDQNFEDFKQKVKDSSDIVDVISGYVSLQKRGRSYWACCPFHGEKTPSFSVNRENQFFYCFGCHTGGDVFTFVEKMENVTFPEALRILAERARIPVPETHRTAADVRRAKAKEELYGVNELAGRYFAACLTKTQYGGKVQAYLQNRGITEDIIRRFSLGASLPGFSSLRHNLSKKGATDQQMLRAGLIREKDGRLLDAFIGRFMIPIKDSRGRIIAFGGRMLGDGVPKYINTGETEIFQKRETLFALDVALRAIRSAKEAIVVEGYMDAISLHAAGVDRVVASLGTAFSQEHAKLLSRIAEAVVFAYDSDDAGRRNAVRAVSIAKQAGLAVKVLNVPEGKDPDEYVRKAGRDAFEQLVKNAWDGTEFQIRYVISQNNVTELAGKVRAVSNIVPYLHESRNDIEAAGYIKPVAQRRVIDVGLIRNEYRRNRRLPDGKTAAPAPAPQSAELHSVPDALAQAEATVLLLFIRNPGLIAPQEEKLWAIGFKSSVRQRLFEKVLNLRQDKAGIADKLLGDEDGEVQAETARILALDNTGNMSLDLQRQTVADCVLLMERQYLEAEYEKHSALAGRYAETNDPRLSAELQICNELRGKITKLYGND